MREIRRLEVLMEKLSNRRGKEISKKQALRDALLATVGYDPGVRAVLSDIRARKLEEAKNAMSPGKLWGHSIWAGEHLGPRIAQASAGQHGLSEALDDEIAYLKSKQMSKASSLVNYMR